MDLIFHERQEGALCAQHCLNSLLQGDYYSAVDLANIAQNLDSLEQGFMSQEPGSRSRNTAQESSNYDDTGYFSIQVLQTALKSWNLELIPYSSSQEVAQIARDMPTEQKAYICNFRNHWYTIRKLGNYWFNLNSLLTKPELVSNMHLSILLAQLINDGYSIFVVDGDLPRSQADVYLHDHALNVKEILNAQNVSKKNSRRLNKNQEDGEDDEFEDELKKAIRMSLIENDMDLDGHGNHFPSLAYESGAAATSTGFRQAFDASTGDKFKKNMLEKNDEEEFKRAIELSMQQDNEEKGNSKQIIERSIAVKEVDHEEIRRKRLEHMEKMMKS